MAIQEKKVRLPQHINPQRYKLTVQPNFEDFTFSGEEMIFLDLKKKTEKIILHSSGLKIERAEFVHENSENWAGKISYDEKSETALFTFPKQLKKGRGQLKLQFRGILSEKMRGFYRSKYYLDGEKQYLATTQFEATDARRAFPCFDEPSFKAIFDLILKVPLETTAISNTIPVSIKELDLGYKIVKFAPTPKMSTYLLAFIVGKFDFIEGRTKEGVRVRVFTTPGKKNQAKFALDVAIKTLSFYSNYFKIPYPLPVLDLIAIPDFESGAMENWGAITYRESALLIDEEKSSTANKQWVALVIAHELAHQWFGNLVTMEWWTHLWLNEGFASFIEYLAIDHIFPKWDIWTQFVHLEKGTALRLDALKNTHPIEVKVHHPGEINEIFDKVSYSKGASIIRMLASYLGYEDFRLGLVHYLTKHQYSNAKTLDLWKALEEISGKPVTKIMNNWTAKAGYPLISVKCKVQSAKLKKLQLTQRRFFSSKISAIKTKDKTIWSIPFDQFLMNKKTLIVPDTGKKLNLGETSFIRVGYPLDFLQNFKNDILKKKISTVDRLGILSDSFALSQAGEILTDKALEFAQSFKKEEDYTVWLELTSYLSQVSNLLLEENFYDSYKKYCRDIFEGIAQKLGWQKKRGEKHTNTLLRGLVLYNLGTYGDNETMWTANLLFKSYLLYRKNIDPDIRSVVYNLVAENGQAKEHGLFIKMYKKEDLQQEKDRIGRALCAFRNKNLLERTLEFSLSKDVRTQDAIHMIGAVWANPKGRDLAWKFVKKNWPLIRDLFGGGHQLSRLLQYGASFTSKADALDFKTFFKKNPVLEASKTISQVLEQIESSADWLSRDRKNISKFLTSITPRRSRA